MSTGRCAAQRRPGRRGGADCDGTMVEDCDLDFGEFTNDLMGFYSDLMGFYSDLMGFIVILWDL